MSTASLAGPRDGTARGAVFSVKIAGSRDEPPYTAALERTTRCCTDEERWQAANNCIVPRTFISLTMVRAAVLAGVADADACTTVSTPAASMIRAISGLRMSALAKSAPD